MATQSGAEHEPEEIPGIPAAAHRGPAIQRTLLGTRLRQLRTGRRIALEDAARAVEISAPKLSRLERGRGVCRESDIAALLNLYNIEDEQERQTYLDLARSANTRGWWQQYADLDLSGLETYLGLEEAAAAIRSCQTQHIPALLQTTDYCRALARLSYPLETEPLIDRRVALLESRQDILDRRPDPPQRLFLIDESALRRPVGGPRVMRAQLRRLIELQSQHHATITLRVLPLRTDVAATALPGSFTLLQFAEPDLRDVAYLEHLFGGLYLDRPTDVEPYRGALDRLVAAATGPTSSLSLFHTLLRDI